MEKETGKRMIRRCFCLLFVALIAPALLVACTLAQSEDQGRQHISSRFEQETETHTFALPVQETAESIELDVDISLETGSVNWQLIGPDGIGYWVDSLRAKNALRQKRGFKPLAGEWMLKILLEDASGYYDIYWQTE